MTPEGQSRLVGTIGHRKLPGPAVAGFMDRCLCCAAAHGSLYPPPPDPPDQRLLGSGS